MTTAVGTEVDFVVPNWFVPATTTRIRWPTSFAVSFTDGPVAKPSQLFPFASQRRQA